MRLRRCQPTFMDRVRLAVPAAHFAEEYLRRPAPHAEEMALSALRFIDMLPLNEGKANVTADANASHYAPLLEGVRKRLEATGTEQFAHARRRAGAPSARAEAT